MEGVFLLNRRVVTRGIELGRVVDVILDEASQPIGLDVRCGDGERRFLPLATARVGEDDIEIDSPLMLLGSDQLDFYRARGRALRSPR
ncbi:MAG: PRC-barrel domain-containing protein [Actinomycetota bacterium]